MAITWKWLAGFYEGEGSCYYARSNGRRRYFRLYIVQQERAPLDSIRKFIGLGVVFRRRRPTKKYKATHAYSLTGLAAVTIARRLLSHMNCPKKIHQLQMKLRAFQRDPDKQRRVYRKS